MGKLTVSYTGTSAATEVILFDDRVRQGYDPRSFIDDQLIDRRLHELYPEALNVLAPIGCEPYWSPYVDEGPGDSDDCWQRLYDIAADVSMTTAYDMLRIMAYVVLGTQNAVKNSVNAMLDRRTRDLNIAYAAKKFLMFVKERVNEEQSTIRVNFIDMQGVSILFYFYYSTGRLMRRVYPVLLDSGIETFFYDDETDHVRNLGDLGPGDPRELDLPDGTWDVAWGGDEWHHATLTVADGAPVSIAIGDDGAFVVEGGGSVSDKRILLATTPVSWAVDDGSSLALGADPLEWRRPSGLMLTDGGWADVGGGSEDDPFLTAVASGDYAQARAEVKRRLNNILVVTGAINNAVDSLSEWELDFLAEAWESTLEIVPEYWGHLAENPRNGMAILNSLINDLMLNFEFYEAVQIRVENFHLTNNGWEATFSVYMENYNDEIAAVLRIPPLG